MNVGLRDLAVGPASEHVQDGPELRRSPDRQGVPVRRAAGAHAALELVDVGDRRRRGVEGRVACRDLDDVRAPERPVAPGARRRVELADPLGDVLPGRQGGVRKAAEGLPHRHDVRAGRERRPGPDDVGLSPADLDAVVQAATPTSRFASASLRWTPRLGETWSADPPTNGIRNAFGYSTIQLCWASVKPRPATSGSSQQFTLAAPVDAAPEDLQLVGQDGGPVLDPEVGRGIEDEVLLALRPERAAAGRVVAHLDGGPVDAEERSVGLAVERAPVVPALGDFRASVLATADAALVPLVDRPLDASSDRLDCRLVGVQPALVPVQELVVLEPRVVRLRQPVDEGGVVVPVHEEPDRGEPFELERSVGAHLRLGLDEQVSVHVEAVLVLPPSGHATVGVRGRDDDDDGMVEELVDRVVRPVRQGDEIADRLHHRVGAFTLPAVDVGLDEHRQLDVLAPGRQQGLGCGRVRQHERPKLLPPCVVALLLGGLERVDHDSEHVPAEGRTLR